MAVVKVVRRVANPRRRTRRKLNPRRRRRLNPALVLTLGAVNPRRRKNTMASRKRRNPRRKSAFSLSTPFRRRRNSYRRRRRNPALAVYRRRYSRRRRNPMFGGVKMTTVAGGLTGVAAARLVSRIIPPALLGFAGQFAPLLSDAISAGIVSWAADKFGGNGGSETAREFRAGVPFGALMLVGSTAISTFVPGLRQYGFGIGALVPGQFPVPQNPIRPLALPAPAENGKTRVNTSGVSRAFGTAF